MAYPASLDVLADPSGAALMNDPSLLHSVVEKKQNDSIEAVQTTLGLNPHGGFLTVAARLTDIESDITGKLDASQKAAASGVASLDSSSLLVQNVDATKIASGLLPLARLANIPVSKIDTASGAFNILNIPNMDAVKITSGVLGLSRIPGLPGNWITSGTIDAARLPSSVTANANATVVADVTARDAIPLVDRANGKLVVVLSPMTLYTWRTDNSTWVQVGGPGAVSEAPLAVEDFTDILGFTNTTFAAGSPVMGTSFTAPASGKVFLTVSAHIEANVAAGTVYVGLETRQGSTVGSGTVQQPADTDLSVAVGAGASTVRGQWSRRWLLTGLTAGNPYNVRTMHLTTSGNGDVFSRGLMVEMVH